MKNPGSPAAIDEPNKSFPDRSRGAREILPRSGPLFLVRGVSYPTLSSDRTLFRLGRFFIAISLLAFGVQHFRYAGYIPDLGLVPDWMPAHLLCAWLAGAFLLLSGLSILTGKFARGVACLLGCVFLLSAFLRCAPLFAGMVHNVSDRTVFFELLSCGAGSWMLAGFFPRDAAGPSSERTAKLAVAGCWLFGVANIVYGIGHFQVAAFIATLIPYWIPFRLFWAYFTGAAFVLAGISIAARRWMRLSGVLLGLMYFLWVVIVHAPRIAHALHNGDEWNSGYVCLTMAGCALIAAALPHRPEQKTA